MEYENEEASGLAGLDAWVYPRSLRTYQLWLAEARPFQVWVEGQRYVCQGCQAGASENVLLLQRLEDGSWFELRSGPCANGHALVGQAMRPIEAPPSPWPGGPALLRVGNGNFAHFLWNELDAVLRLLARGLRLQVVQDQDTVLDLATLPGVEKLPATALQAHCSVRVGSMVVTRQAQELVVASLRAEQQDKAADLADATPQPLTSSTEALSPCPPHACIVLGVRGPGRRELLNEVEFYVELIGAIREKYGSIRILLDGFTYQRNQGRERRRSQREFLCTERVQKIIESCGGSDLECLSGLPFSDWLEQVSTADFYITHEGTMQHKLGWLLPSLPGLCLIGPDTAHAIVRWHLLQCEQHATLSHLPVELMAMEPQDQGQQPERDRSFRIVAIASAIEAILAILPETRPGGAKTATGVGMEDVDVDVNVDVHPDYPEEDQRDSAEAWLHYANALVAQAGDKVLEGSVQKEQVIMALMQAQRCGADETTIRAILLTRSTLDLAVAVDDLGLKAGAISLRQLAGE